MSTPTQHPQGPPGLPGIAAVARSRVGDRELARYVRMELAAFSPHYRSSFGAAGVRPRRVRGIEDLQSVKPVGPEDLSSDPDRFRLRVTPAGLREEWGFAAKLGLVAGGRRAFKNLLTAYSPVLEFRDEAGEGPAIATTGADLERMAEAGSRRLGELGLGPGKTLVLEGSSDSSLASWWVRLSGLRAACKLVPGGSDPLEACVQSEAEALWTTVEGALELARRARAEAAALGRLEQVLVRGAGLDQQARLEIAEGLAAAGARVRVGSVLAHTPTRTVLVESPFDPLTAGEGPGYPIPDRTLAVEVVEPGTGSPVEKESPGELLLTPLFGRGTALIRFRAGFLPRRGLSWRTCPETNQARAFLPTNVEHPATDTGSKT